MAKLTTERLETNDPKTTVGISIRRSLVRRIKERADRLDVNFSWMCAQLLAKGLESTEN